MGTESFSSEIRLRQLEKAVETLQIGVTVADVDGRIVYVNPADAQMHGYTVDELLGQEARIYSPQEWSKPRERPDIRTFQSWNRESINVRRDGQQFPVLITSDVVYDERGEPLGIVTSCQDITERKAAEEALRESEERYALAMKGANDGLWDWILDTDEIYYSPRWLDIVGCGEDQIAGRPEDWIERVHPADRKELKAKLEDHIQGHSPHLEDEHRIQHADGRFRWVRCRGLVVRDNTGQARRMAGSLADITSLKARDPLTALPNRSLLNDRLEVCFARARRHPELTFALLFLDLDRFKNINDTLGHLIGDRLLEIVARRVEAILREGDTIARFGGDEFVIIVDDIRGSDDALLVADRIHEVMAEPLAIQGRDFFVTMSIGVTVNSRRYQSPDELLRDADLAMHQAKALGGSRSSVFDASLRVAAAEQLRLETDLRRAIDQKEFALHFQPIMDLADGQLRGFEALIRWHCPDRGLLMPDEFLSVAEETGLIVPIGEWVLNEACRQMSEWHSRFPDEPLPKISVNVSAKQVVHESFADDVLTALKKVSLDPRTLILELTESTMLQHPDQVNSSLVSLRDQGIEICLDDFGTGYSSLSYLQKLPVDTLKIDRAFVKEMNTQSRDMELVRTILQIGRDLGLAVIAEGIETTEQLEGLRSMECRLGQGFTLARPVPPNEAVRFLEGNR